MIEEELIKRLKQIQKAYSWSQAKMAKELGVSRPLLSQIYAGERILQLKTLKGIVARFPELKPQVVKTLG
jgi:transcriptional regulator with XRE-family HTH domain